MKEMAFKNCNITTERKIKPVLKKAALAIFYCFFCEKITKYEVRFASGGRNRQIAIHKKT